MKKIKLSATIIAFVLVLGVMGFGVFAAITKTTGITNNISFVASNKQVFVTVTGEYAGPPQQGENVTSAYSQTISKDTDDFNFPTWNIGNTVFTEENNEISIIFSFENLNDEYDLEIVISKIAYDSNGRFSTVVTDSATLGGNVINFEEGAGTGDIATLNKIIVPKKVGATASSKIVNFKYTLVNVNRSFDFINNLQIVMTALVPVE